jgi:replicative superfamily II helicase
LASDGKLAYIISDDSISYGTNYPINRVIITKDFSDTHSINTIFQVLGRAGRIGKSWKAEAFIDKTLEAKMQRFAKGETENIEIINMNKMYDKIIENENKSLEMEIQKLEENIVNKQMKIQETEKLKQQKETNVKEISDRWYKQHMSGETISSTQRPLTQQPSMEPPPQSNLKSTPNLSWKRRAVV